MSIRYKIFAVFILAVLMTAIVLSIFLDLRYGVFVLGLTFVLGIGFFALFNANFQSTINEQTEELQKYKLAVAHAAEHIIITDPTGKILYANKAVEKITGYASEEVIGKTPRLWGGQMSEEFYKNFWKTIKEDKEIFEGEIKNVRKNGEEYIAETRVAPVTDDNGEVLYFVGIERDITKEKEVDRAKTEFVSLASHQLRSPLSTINWYTEMLIDGNAGKINEKQFQYLREVRSAKSRMAGIIDALLNVSRLELGTFTLEPEPTDICKLAESITKDYEQKIKEKSINFERVIGDDIPIMNVDRDLLMIIIQNLISNAVKYTQENGDIEFKIQRKDPDLLIQVSDNGCGIPKDSQGKIFSKLFRASNVEQIDPNGNGLGLYIAKSILEKSNGEIWFDSEEDVGTTFYVTIPLSGMKVRKNN